MTPKFKASATARYSWPMGPGMRTSRALMPTRGRRPSDLEPAQECESSAKSSRRRLVDLFAGYDWGGYSAELFATNVFDERNEMRASWSAASARR